MNDRLEGLGTEKSELADQIEVLTAVNRCVGHSLCRAVAADVYVLSEDGFNDVASRRIDGSLREAALRGARACPERIIVIKELKK